MKVKLSGKALGSQRENDFPPGAPVKSPVGYEGGIKVFLVLRGLKKRLHGTLSRELLGRVLRVK